MKMQYSILSYRINKIIPVINFMWANWLCENHHLNNSSALQTGYAVLMLFTGYFVHNDALTKKY